MASFFKINGVDLPVPSVGLKIKRSQFVDSARNAQGQVVAQKINRRILKFEPVKWSHLTALEWRNILVEIDKFEGELYFFDNLTGTFKTYRVYWGDASAEVFKTNSETGEILEYVNCTCNIIDMGY